MFIFQCRVVITILTPKYADNGIRELKIKIRNRFRKCGTRYKDTKTAKKIRPVYACSDEFCEYEILRMI